MSCLKSPLWPHVKLAAKRTQLTLLNVPLQGMMGMPGQPGMMMGGGPGGGMMQPGMQAIGDAEEDAGGLRREGKGSESVGAEWASKWTVVGGEVGITL